MNILITVQNKIPSLYYGGTERVVWYLGEELQKMGHTVTFLAPKGSYCDFAKVLVLNSELPLNDQIPDSIDVVHVNDDHFFETITKPHIVTVHGNPSFDKELNKNCVFVSKNHASRYNAIHFVHNGLNWDYYSKPNLDVKRTHFHFLGKAAWDVKNVRGAINTILATDKERLRILGGNRFHPNTFTFSSRIKFEGMVNDSQKGTLLNHSKGIIFPVLWNEPFGLALIESLFYGCPVFGTPYGSLPELISEEFGVLSNNQTVLKEALLNSESYSQKMCHEYAQTTFNAKNMALNYLQKYEIVLNGSTIHDHAPQFISNPSKSIEWIV